MTSLPRANNDPMPLMDRFEFSIFQTQILNGIVLNGKLFDGTGLDLVSFKISNRSSRQQLLSTLDLSWPHLV